MLVFTLGIYILTFVHANPIFVPTAHLTIAHPTLSIPDPTLGCDGVMFGGGIFVSDCQRAVSQLPRDEAGDVMFDFQTRNWIYPVFSRHALEERHCLPQVSGYGSCTVEIRLYGWRLNDNSSWRILALRAGHVIDACVRGMSGIGGGVSTGVTKGIEVVVHSTKLQLNTSNSTLNLMKVANMTL